MEIEIDDTFRLAERYVEDTGVSVFLTGKAGTGKTTFLKYITDHTAKRHVVLAPTGVAAINAGGQTIHSFFLLPLCPYLPEVKELITEYQMPESHRSLRKDRVKIIRTLDLLIIDEISMVRADLLDAVDMTLRRYRRSDKPFGGVQLLMIGDSQQLSPVVKENEREYLRQVYPSPYFFCSKALSRLGFVTIELTKVHRQKDADFLEILNSIRENRPTKELLCKLNTRVGAPLPGDPIRLMTHNRQADEFNAMKLEALPGMERIYTASVEGEYPASSYPTDEEISLKEGARVIFLRNDQGGAYYNGKLGVVTELCADGSVKVACDDGTQVSVTEATWENVQYELNPDSGEIEQIVVGEFSQIPLRPAWAITIHKSQGLTFDSVIVDSGAAFAFGQVYVALSRCRSLEGLSLMTHVHASSLYTDEAVSGFTASIPPVSSVREQLEGWQRRHEFEMMRSVFSFGGISDDMWRLSRLWQDNLSRLYESQKFGIRNRIDKIREQEAVAGRFRGQLSRIESGGVGAGGGASGGCESGGEVSGAGSAEHDGANVCTHGGANVCLYGGAYLAGRLKKAAEWFLPFFEEMVEWFGALYELEIDNKETKRKVRESLDALMCDLEIECGCLKLILERGFNASEVCRIRTACIVAEKSSTPRRKKTKAGAGSGVGSGGACVGAGSGSGSGLGSGSGSGSGRGTGPGSVAGSCSGVALRVNEELRDALMEWRKDRFQAENIPAYRILHQTTLLEIASKVPTTRLQLLEINGFGEAKFQKYGADILSICRIFAASHQ